MNILTDALSLSSGTISTLTGKTLYSEIDRIQSRFVIFVQKTEGLYKTWSEAWNDFKEGHL